MNIIVVGLDYQTAPVQIREKLVFKPSQLGAAIAELMRKKGILENVLLSTCNRTEVYAVVNNYSEGRFYIKKFLSEWFHFDQEMFSPYLFVYEQEEAVRHLFKVTCGLDSMILGETQILGQVRTSFLEAQNERSIGTVFNHLFKESITLAKRAHSVTEIADHAVSVSYAAVKLAKKVFGTLQEKSALIVGAGKMSELAIQNLYSNGVRRVTIINRTLEKAKILAARLHAEVKPLDKLHAALVDADILISSTGASDVIITKNTMKQIGKIRKGKPLIMIDIAVPRDIDPQVAELDNVFLYNIDDLNRIVEDNFVEREKAAKEIMKMIEGEVTVFNQWMKMLEVTPIISAMHNKAFEIQAEIMDSIKRKLPNLTEHELKVINNHTKSIINQMLKDPILEAKGMAVSGEKEKVFGLFIKTFNIEEQLKEQANNCS